MAITNTDLLLVQRGAVPMKAEASSLATYVKGEVEASDIGIASASQLGVIRVGNNLQIDANGVLDAVIPAGVEYRGVWVDPNNTPSPLQNGYFWIWDGGDGVDLNSVSWGSANGTTMNNGDRIFYDGSQFDIVPSGGGGGGGGLQSVVGVAPITVDNTDPAHPEVGINPATTSSAGSLSASDKQKLDSLTAGAEPNVAQNLAYSPAANSGTVTIDQSGTDATIPAATTTAAGLLSATDKQTLDNLVASPGGVVSITGGAGITVDSSVAATPEISVTFGSAPNGTPVTVMPYDISMLAELT